MKFIGKITSLLLILLVGFPLILQGQKARIDHVITVVSNLEKKVGDYTANGFTIRKGKLHANGLINAHIKFDNSSSFELMSIEGKATDPMALEYESLLNEGEGGVYLVMTGFKTESVISLLDKFTIEYEVIKGKLWSYVTFPSDSDLAHLFFIEYHFDQKDPQDILTHQNGIERISSVVIEGNKSVIDFLKNIGLKHSGQISDPGFGIGTEFETQTGNIIIVPQKNPNARPRVRSIILKNITGTKSIRLPLE
ncbi:MAG: hypothetical protein HKN68_03380 [Saprospiraceae bacterium]|nr:hypothetical protein [Saprospiraceae bacterium]